MSETSRLLQAIDAGDPNAAGELLPRISDELRRLAACELAAERPGQTLHPTALVHEAYLRGARDAYRAALPLRPAALGLRHVERLLLKKEAARPAARYNPLVPSATTPRGLHTMFDTISRSWSLALASWRVLATDKKLIVFPILSGLASLVVLLSFFVPLAVLVNNGTVKLETDERTGLPLWAYGFLFAFYFCSYFVIVFCNAALVSCALMRFNGQEPSIAAGVGAAFARLPQIVAWSLVSATVGVLLKVIESAHEKVGEIIAAVLGTAWTVITYFVVPVLVVEKVGPFQAVSRSLSLLRQTWGESLVGGVGLGLFQFLLFIPGVLLLVGGGYLAANVAPPMIGFGVLLFGFVWLLGAAAVSAALDTIFLSALYQYAAHKQVPAGFDAGTIRHAFEPKKG